MLRVGRGGGGELLVISEKNIRQNDFQGKNICTEKKNLMAYNAGKKTYTKSPTPPPPPPQKSNGRLGPGKSKMADVYSVGTQVGLLYLFTS